MFCTPLDRLTAKIVCIGAICSGSTSWAADAPARVDPPPPQPPVAMTPPPTLRAGLAFGVLSPQAVRNITVLRPWATRFTDNYQLDTHLIYTLHRFEAVPLDIEVEADIAKRFGSSYGGSAWEFAMAPILRWRWFPWNDYVYTNIRLGLVGASYVTKVSRFERDFDARGHGSRYLNWVLYEWTFAPRETSPFEVFVRVHHRSGAGVINRTRGGSNYVGAGVRFTVY